MLTNPRSQFQECDVFYEDPQGKSQKENPKAAWGNNQERISHAYLAVRSTSNFYTTK